MKNTNIDQKIFEQLIPNNTLYSPEQNNNIIRELRNIILSNRINLGPNIETVNIYNLYIYFYFLQIPNERRNNLINTGLFNINENNNIINFENHPNLNVNNNLSLRFLQNENRIPNNIFINNLYNNNNFDNNDVLSLSQNNILYNSFYHDNNHDNNINVNNINNRNINNCINEQNKFLNLFQKDNTYLYKNNLSNNINNINNNNFQLNNDKFVNSSSFVNPYNLNINIKNSNIYNNINQEPSYNPKKTNLNKINIIKNKNELNFNFHKTSLTTLLCEKNGINQIKSLLKSEEYNIDLIRKIILTLNKENGLFKVFTNIYGNYFIQDLFKKMNNDLIQLTIDLISSEFVNISKTPSGTHCLQELLNYINDSEKEISIIKSIKYKEKEMAFDKYATYVLKKIILIIPDTKRVRLNNAIIDNTKELSLNSNSVFILKQFIATNTIQENKNKIINALKKNFLLISQNPFGNYVIQYIFEVWPIKDCEPIVNEIFNKVNDLSCQHFSVNIVLKALNVFNNEYKNKLIYIICFSPNILNLLNNKYGNFVVNKAVNEMDSDTKIKLENYLEGTFKNISSKEKMLIDNIISLLRDQIINVKGIKSYSILF